MTDSPKEIINQAWKSGKEGIKNIGYTINNAVAGIGNILKAGYQTIDAGDKAIGKGIEKKMEKKGKDTTGKVKKFFRNNIMKLLLGASVLTYGGVEGYQHIKEKGPETIELTIDDQTVTIDVNEIFGNDNVIHDLKGAGKKRQEKWYNNYQGNNEVWNKMNNNFGIHERKKVIEGLCRMIESGDINMIFEKADEAGVPRQCIYLALAESGRTGNADSGKAGGWWQFTPQSAIDFGLNEVGGPDNRGDKVLSTEATMKHLKANYDIVCNYEKQLKYHLTESDRWFLAFSMFNGSPRLVKSGMIACNGNINNYPDQLKAPNGRKENNNYTARILALEDFGRDLFKENGYNLEKVKEIGTILGEYLKKTADKMYENYLAQRSGLTKEDRIDKLNTIMKKYDDELRANLISQEYHDGAIKVIKEEIEVQNKGD